MGVASSSRSDRESTPSPRRRRRCREPRPLGSEAGTNAIEQLVKNGWPGGTSMKHLTLRYKLALILSPWLAASAFAQTPLVAQASATGRLEGVVTDSLQDAPL